MIPFSIGLPSALQITFADVVPMDVFD